MNEDHARSVQLGSSPSRQAVLQQLEEMLSSPSFESAERSKRLLRFLVEETLEGRADRLKEYTLATQALGRSTAFDPRSDPIVRAEASRLRSRLDQYFGKEGQADLLRIDLPKGSYVPRFTIRTPPLVSQNKGKQPPRRARIAVVSAAFVAVALTAVSIAMAVVWGIAGEVRPGKEISIAVIPLANLSADAGREFFADGMTDEIAAALARVPNLKVVARSSAYALKNQTKPAREVGLALGATHFIEGSVRQDRGRVRIAVQLTDAKSGLQLWSGTYDREVTDIFVVQEDIARTVTASLNLAIGLRPGENLVNNRGVDPESYEEFLRGKAQWETRGVPEDRQDSKLLDAATLFEGVVGKNPSYAPAWAMLGAVYYGLSSNITAMADATNARAVASEFRLKGEAAARTSMQLDSSLAAAHGDLGVFAWSRANLLEADGYFSKALVLDSFEHNSLGAYAIRLGTAGRLKDALDLIERAYKTDPFYPNIAREVAQDRWLNGNSQSAIALAMTLRPSDRAIMLALILSSEKKFGEAADALDELEASDPHSDIALAARLLRRGAAAMPTSAKALPRLPMPLNMLYIYLGAPERALEPFERIADRDFLYGNWGTVWHPDYAPVRKTERFKALMRRAGLVNYWRSKGWPEWCHPTTDGDFLCE